MKRLFYPYGTILALCALTFFTLLLPSCGGDKITIDPENDSSTFNFGQAVYQLSRNYLYQTPPNSLEKVQALDNNRENLVYAVNTIIPEEVNQNILAPLKLILPLVDDGTLPKVTDDLQEILSYLLQHPNDPNKETLQAIVDLARTKGLSLRDWSLLLGRLIQYPELEKVMLAISQLVRENDGVDDLGNPNGEKNLLQDLLAFLSRKLREMKPSPNASNSSLFSLISLQKELLSEITVRSPLGAPAYSVRLDKNGNPQPAINPSTGTFFPPFVDQNNDGYADTNAEGNFVDAQGQEIQLKPFGKNGIRDQYGRLLNSPGGSPVFVYFNTKKTLLSVLLHLIGVAVQKKLPSHSLQLLESILPPAQNHDNGTPADPSDDFKTYPATNNPLLDLLYGLLELFKYNDSPKLLSAFENITKNQPKLTENLLISLGKVFHILQNTPIPLSKPDLYKLIEDLIPLLEDVSKKPNNSSTSTARVLMQTIYNLGQIARNLPGQLANMSRYTTFTTKQLVDFSQPPTPNNRSTLQQMLNLWYDMDQCKLPIINQTITEVTLNLVADMNPTTVKNLILKLDGVLATFSWFINLYCPGFTQNRTALNELALSGALDAFIPIVKVFKDRGEIRLLIEILNKLHLNFNTVLRKAEPTLIKILDSGAVQNLFDVIALTTQIQVPNSTDKAADVIADSIANLLDSTKTVFYRNGTQAPRLLSLLYEPWKTLDTKISSAGKTSQLDQLLKGLLDYIAETVVNNNGTPNDPSDDFEELKYPDLIPLLAKVSAKISAQLGTNASNRSQKVQSYQKDLENFLTSKDFYALLDLLRVIENSPTKTTLYQALENLFTPQNNYSDDVFGALLAVLASALQVKSNQSTLQQLAWFIGDMLQPSRPYAKDFVLAIQRIIVKDEGKIVLTMLRNLFIQNPQSPYNMPILEIYNTFSAVQKAAKSNASSPPLTAAELESTIRSLLKFMKDPKAGLPKFYEQIRKRRRRQ
ncbi:MAG: hypothetical protein D6805_08790 [Planctomycetota bacterium]|nr:MAG: hypothetical protein D6805_08790 [Planctomycetota bacterium]